MWSDAGGGGYNNFGGDDGAGYGTQQFSSPAPEAKKGRRLDSILPLTIGNVLALDENTEYYLGTEINIVTLVGLICEVNFDSAKVTYTVDDTTSTIPIIKWIDAESVETPLMENTYCRVHGTIKTHNGAKQIVALHLEPVTSLNCVTAHILEVIHATLQLKRLNNEDTTNMGNGTAGASNMSNSMMGLGRLGGPDEHMDGAGGSSELILEPHRKKVYEMIRMVSAQGEDNGCSREDIRMKVKDTLSTHQIDEAILFLSNEGHIYTTVDNNHFRATEI